MYTETFADEEHSVDEWLTKDDYWVGSTGGSMGQEGANAPTRRPMTLW